MKYIIPFLLLAFNINAQEVVSDVTYLTNVSGVFIENTKVIYDNGKTIITSVPIGDTLTTLNTFADRYDSKVSTIANDIRVVRLYRGITSQILIDNDTIATVLGVSPLKVLQDKYAAILLGDWTLKAPDRVDVNIKFTINSSGQLRYLVTGSTSKQAIILSKDCVKLNSFPASGQNIDLFMINSKKWSDANGRTLLIKK